MRLQSEVKKYQKNSFVYSADGKQFKHNHFKKFLVSINNQRKR